MAHSKHISDNYSTPEEWLAAYWQGELTAEQKKQVLQWSKEDPSHEAMLKEYEQAWHQSRLQASDVSFDVTKAWSKVKAQTFDKEVHIHRSLAWWQQPFMRAAAAVVAVMTFTWLFSLFLFKRPDYIDVVAGIDSIKIHELPDHSLITLRNGARIRYSGEYNEEKREIWLDGEAFFEVTKNPEKPFSVMAHRSRTIVKGTSFAVKSIKSDSFDFVSVEEGKVAVMEKYAQTVAEQHLTAGMSAKVNTAGNVIVLSEAEASVYQPAWKTLHIGFHNQPLSNVIESINSMYGVSITLENPALGKCRFTGEFKQNSLEQVIEVLTASMSLEAKKQSPKNILLSGNSCH
jgi:ferric-dicitrate binding protein FerR (iron transport regulator)